MLKAKKNSMYIDVTGVDDMTDRSTLMEEIIRRNCDVDPRIINSLVNKLGRYGDENHKLTSYQKTMYRMDYGVKGANRIEKDYSKGVDKKTAVEREKKRIARGKAVSRAVASVYVYDYLTGGKVSSAAKNAAKHAVARALTNMAAEKAYKNETRGRMYAQYTEV